MQRINIYQEAEYGQEFIGWFDLDKAQVLAKHKEGDPYTSYNWIYLTAGGKLILEQSNNHLGMSAHYYTITGRRAVELINEAVTEEGLAWAKGKGAPEFEKAEIK